MTSSEEGRYLLWGNAPDSVSVCSAQCVASSDVIVRGPVKGPVSKTCKLSLHGSCWLGIRSWGVSVCEGGSPFLLECA
jgi:hypothetical protein